MKNVLMIIPFFPPIAGGGVFRPLGFVRYLGGYGWRPTVIAPCGESFWIKDHDLLKRIPARCEVIKTDTLSAQRILRMFHRKRGEENQVRSSRRYELLRKLSSFVLMPDTYIGWYPFAVRAGIMALKKKRFDAIYSTSPPETSHLIAYRLWKHSGLSWAADFRDPWMNLHLYRPPTLLHRRLHKSLEGKVLENAGTVVTSRFHFEKIKEQFPEILHVRLISNGYDGEEVDNVMHTCPDPDKFRIIHAGMLTQKRSAEGFLKGLKLFLEKRPETRERIEVIFLGAREDRNEVKVRELGLDGIVKFLDTVSHMQALEMERTAQVLLLIKHVDPLYKGIVPGKLYEYIGLCRPILALAPQGETMDIITKLNRGELAPQNDEGKIADKLGLLYDKYSEASLEDHYDLSPRPEYDRRELAGKLAEFLDELISKRGGM